MSPEVAVIATPPEKRHQTIAAMPGLRGVLVEKPLGRNLAEARKFANQCRELNLVVQVNFFRRADALTRSLAAGELTRRIGRVQATFGLYGRGFHNIAPHLIDLTRMLIGEPVGVRATGPVRAAPDAVLADDVAIPFALELDSGSQAVFQPIDFTHYREAGLDIWGTTGRMSILQEGLGVYLSPLCENRGLEQAMEIASDRAETIASTYTDAIPALYDNFANALDSTAKPFSSLDSAMRTENVMAAILASAAEGGARITLANGIN